MANQRQPIIGNGVDEQYFYDADGQRVKKIVNGVATFYPSGLVEQTGGVVTKYYYFAGQRVAMRKDGVLTYLHGDHLGSTVLETDATGNNVGDERFLAFGKKQSGVGVGTDHGFTGQKHDGSGLIYMNARYYDPKLGTFISPDTIVPDPGRVIDYNRYIYASASPLKYVDPTGHDDILPGIPNPFEWLMHLIGLNTEALENTGVPEFQDLDTNLGEDVYSV